MHILRIFRQRSMVIGSQERTPCGAEMRFMWNWTAEGATARSAAAVMAPWMGLRDLRREPRAAARVPLECVDALMRCR